MINIDANVERPVNGLDYPFVPYWQLDLDVKTKVLNSKTLLGSKVKTWVNLD